MYTRQIYKLVKKYRKDNPSMQTKQVLN
jgi:hypothetical protein